MARRPPQRAKRSEPWGRQAVIATVLCVGLAVLAMTTSGFSRLVLGGLAFLLALIAIYAQGQRRRQRDELRRTSGSGRR